MNRSLKFRLSLWLALVMVAIAAANGIYSYVKAFQEATELQDDQLRQMAALIDYYDMPITNVDQASVKDVDPEFRVWVQELEGAIPDNLRKKQRKRFLDLPAQLPDGLQTLSVHGKSWRLFVRDIRSGRRIVLAQKSSTRDEVAQGNAMRTVAPFLVVIPVMVILIVLIVQRTFRPVTRLSHEIDAHAEDDLERIDDSHVPNELRPFVSAINGLLERMRKAMDAQRRFVADAAHELRSPLTALSLQAERVEAAEMSAPARERLATLRGGLRRTAGLLDQLLTLARMQEQPAASKGLPASVSVQSVFRRVLEDLMPLAEAKNIDLGVASEEDATVALQEIDLTTLVANLASNAVRYTPAGGRVDLRVHRVGGALHVEVEDTGPGIPDEDRERIFDPFYRVLGSDEMGSGLGLSIVKTIADRIGAQVVLTNLLDGTRVLGLRAALVLPPTAVRGAA